MGFLDGVDDVVDDATDVPGDVAGEATDSFFDGGDAIAGIGQDFADWHIDAGQDLVDWEVGLFEDVIGGTADLAGDTADAATDVPGDVIGGIFGELAESPFIVLGIALIIGYVLIQTDWESVAGSAAGAKGA